MDINIVIKIKVARFSQNSRLTAEKPRDANYGTFSKSQATSHFIQWFMLAVPVPLH